MLKHSKTEIDPRNSHGVSIIQEDGSRPYLLGLERLDLGLQLLELGPHAVVALQRLLQLLQQLLQRFTAEGWRVVAKS
jgi:hypothetical protein